ncbi:zinc finger, CCHC-type containing protein [Tanacetum coccineum]
MASSFAKLEKFEGVDFIRWQKKMHFILSNMSVVYVLNTLMPEDGGENPTIEQVMKRAKWDNDDNVCRGLILNGVSDSLFDVYQNVETSKELWDTLEAKYMAEDASSKKFLISNFTNYKTIDSRPVLEQYNNFLGILGRFTQHKMNMDESIQVSCIIDKLLPSWKDFKHTLKHLKEELTLIELGSHLRIKESLKAQDNDKLKVNNVVGPLVVNIVEHNNSSSRTNGSSTKGSEDGSSNPLKGQNMFNKSHQIYYVTYISEAFFVQDDDVTWWVDSGATVHVYKDRFWFKTYESLNDGSILHMGNESTALMHGRGCVDLRLNIVSDNIGSAFMSTSKLNDSILWHARLGHVHFKRMKDMSKDGDLCDLHATPSLGNKKYFVIFIDDVSRFCYVNLLHSKDEALDKFKVFKTEFELQQGSLIKRFKTDRGGEYMDTLYFQSVGVIHETTALYTLQQNGISKRKNKVLKEMDNSMLSYSGLSQGLWGEALLTACYLLNRVPNKRNRVTPYELWTKKKPNLNYLRVWGCRAVVRLPDPKLKTLGERGIKCIFVGYAEHSKAFRFYVIEPNDSVAINSIIESRDAIFDGHRFSSVPRPSQRSLKDRTEDSGGSVVSERVTDEIVQQSEPELRKSKRHRTLKDFRPEFQLYLIEGTRDEVSDQHSYCFNVEDDPKTFDEAMKSQDVAFWKEAINDEMDSIMGNNTWVLTDLPPGCRPLGCKWIFKRKLKVDGTVEKFKARLSDYSSDGYEDSFLEWGTGRGGLYKPTYGLHLAWQ